MWVVFCDQEHLSDLPSPSDVRGYEAKDIFMPRQNCLVNFCIPHPRLLIMRETSSQQHPLHARELSRLHHIFLYQQSAVELPVWRLFFGPKDVTHFIKLNVWRGLALYKWPKIGFNHMVTVQAIFQTLSAVTPYNQHAFKSDIPYIKFVY